MSAEIKFSLKHYFPSLRGVTMEYFKKIYPRMPALITTLPELPNIFDFEHDVNGIYKNDFISKNKIEVNVINTVTKTITNMHTHVHITFLKKNNEFYPVHIYRLSLDDAIVHYTQKIF